MRALSTLFAPAAQSAITDDGAVVGVSGTAAFALLVLWGCYGITVDIVSLVTGRFVVANSAAVDVPASWLPVLGVLKAAGAAGVLLGLLGVPVIGTAAATGLVLLYLGAVGAHVRVHAYSTIAAPALFLALPVGTLLTGG